MEVISDCAIVQIVTNKKKAVFVNSPEGTNCLRKSRRLAFFKEKLLMMGAHLHHLHRPRGPFDVKSDKVGRPTSIRATTVTVPDDNIPP